MLKRIVANMIVGGMYILLALLILMLLKIFPALFIACLIVADSIILIILTIIFVKMIRKELKELDVWEELGEQLEKLKGDFERKKK